MINFRLIVASTGNVITLEIFPDDVNKITRNDFVKALKTAGHNVEPTAKIIIDSKSINDEDSFTDIKTMENAAIGHIIYTKPPRDDVVKIYINGEEWTFNRYVTAPNDNVDVLHIMFQNISDNLVNSVPPEPTPLPPPVDAAPAGAGSGAGAGARPAMTGGNKDFKQKYLKYKEKYLALKNNM